MVNQLRALHGPGEISDVILRVAAEKWRQAMATYQNCEAADEVQQMTHGYGFHIRSNNRPIVTLVFATEEDAK